MRDSGSASAGKCCGMLSAGLNGGVKHEERSSRGHLIPVALTCTGCFQVPPALIQLVPSGGWRQGRCWGE